MCCAGAWRRNILAGRAKALGPDCAWPVRDCTGARGQPGVGVALKGGCALFTLWGARRAFLAEETAA